MAIAVAFKTNIYHKLLMLQNTSLAPLGLEAIRLYRKYIALGVSGYEQIRPIADYAPWSTDREFLDIYRAIKPYTLVDLYRCYELWTLVEQSKKLRGSIIEIGVWRGGSGALIAKKAQLCDISETVFLCDTFAGVVKYSAKDPLYRGGEHDDTSQESVHRMLNDQLGLTNVRILPGIFPEDTSQHVEHEIFRLCHVDVDVYQSAKDITEWIWGRLVIGGIIVYDDYGFFECGGITSYIDEQRHSGDRLVLHNLNGHAVIIKIA